MSVVGIGVDIVEIARIEAAISRQGDKFLERLFTSGEREYCASMRVPAPFYAARFAAKEAVAKAFGTGICGRLGWQEIEVRRQESGLPYVVLHGPAVTLRAELGISEILLSISHAEHYAVAQAVALGERPAVVS